MSRIQLRIVLLIVVLAVTGIGSLIEWINGEKQGARPAGDNVNSPSGVVVDLPDAKPTSEVAPSAEDSLAEWNRGVLRGPDEVAIVRHIVQEGTLPNSFVTKNQARDLGWNASDGNLREVAPGKSIGGDRFMNREKELPDAPGRKYFEADLGYDGGHRGAERLVYSNDGLIFVTRDHYKSFQEVKTKP
ncbi:ribonuclease domain-containing protein [Bremerella cremea]|uniref:ribonuclease domain-containing protein n=1 Tax=Bremerella cremea TaxID=1031537 RepID=UPI0031E92BA1